MSATAWANLATALRTAWEDTQKYTAFVLGECEGPAADGFNTRAEGLIDPSKGSLSLVLQACEATERSCRDQAKAIRDLEHQFEELAIQMVVTFIVGQIISAFTAEAGLAADEAAEAGLASRAMALLRTFISAVVERMKTVGQAIEDAVRVLPEGEGTASAAAQTAESVAKKLTAYLLNPDHAKGAAKAKWFQQALGFTASNADQLAAQIVFDPVTAVETGVTQYGTKYNQVINIVGTNGRTIPVTFAWIRNTDGVVRLVTAIPTPK